MIDKRVKDIAHVCAYLDEILITGNSKQEHINATDAVLDRLEQVGFRLKKEKCTFLADSEEYMGLKVDKQCLHPLEKKITALKSAPLPKDVHQLRSFLGMVNHYNKFIMHSATILTPLYQLLGKNATWK